MYTCVHVLYMYKQFTCLYMYFGEYTCMIHVNGHVHTYVHTYIHVLQLLTCTLWLSHFLHSGNSGVVCNICSRDVLFTNYYVNLHVVNAHAFMYYMAKQYIAMSVKLNYCHLSVYMYCQALTYMYVHLHVYVHTYIHVTAAGDVLWVCVQWADDRVWWQCWSGFFLEHHQHPHCMYIHVHVYTYIYKHTYSERTHLSFTVHMCRCVIVLCCSLQGIKNVVRELRIVGLRYMYMYHYTTWYTKSQHYSTICRSNKDSQPDWQFELTHNFTHIKHQNSKKNQTCFCKTKWNIK